MAELQRPPSYAPANAPTATKYCRIYFPAPHVLLVLISREHKMNSLPVEGSHELDSIFRWFDNEPSCRVAVITGSGKAFCAGADLTGEFRHVNGNKFLSILFRLSDQTADSALLASGTEWMMNNKNGVRMSFPEGGFGGLSLRQGKKPVIAAVNGIAYGGGCEIVINCDLVVASPTASFALPEVKVGVTPFAGALPRLMRAVGRQRATELALTGRSATAQEFKEWGLCNYIVEEGEDVVAKAIEFAGMISGNSPDATIITREGLKLGWEALGVVDASRMFFLGWGSRIHDGPNMQEGLDAFVEKRRPRWVDSKL